MSRYYLDSRNSLPDSEIAAGLRPYGVAAPPELCGAIRTYVELLLRWNQRISLTSVTNEAEIVRFHFGESLFASSCMPVGSGRLADVGSGAGFPGLPLRLSAPQLSLLLVESNSKKAAFLAEVVRRLGLKGVEVFRGRMEELPNQGDKFDFVTSRALGHLARLIDWSRHHLNRGGHIILWVGREDTTKVGSWAGFDWRDPVPIPGSERRFLLIGKVRN